MGRWKNVVVLDTETTGLNPEEHELIAVGWSDVWLYRPKIFVRRPGEPVHFLASRVNPQLHDVEVIVGYNVGFDRDFLVRWLGPYYEDVVYVDLMDAVKEVHGRRMKLVDVLHYYLPCIPNDDDNGAKMPELWERGEIARVRYHLEMDVKRTWLLAQIFRPWINEVLEEVV